MPVFIIAQIRKNCKPYKKPSSIFFFRYLVQIFLFLKWQHNQDASIQGMLLLLECSVHHLRSNPYRSHMAYKVCQLLHRSFFQISPFDFQSPKDKECSRQKSLNKSVYLIGRSLFLGIIGNCTEMTCWKVDQCKMTKKKQGTNLSFLEDLVTKPSLGLCSMPTERLASETFGWQASPPPGKQDVWKVHLFPHG